MNEILELTKRNVKIFLRDKTAVFFSFLSIIILLGLYMLFLKNAYTVKEMTDVLSKNQTTFFTFSLLMSGVLVINTLTLSLGNLGNIVNDFDQRLMDAFVITPVKKIKIILAYYFSSFLITVFFTLVLWFLTILIIGLMTTYWYGIGIIVSVTGILILYTFISSAVMIFITTFIKSTNAFGAVAGIFGTVVGFMCGIYMPLSILPKAIRNISSLLPFTHMTILLKQLLTKQSLQEFSTVFPAEVIDNIRSSFVINEIPVFGLYIKMGWLLVFSVLLAVLCIFLSTWRLKKRIKIL